MHKKNQDTSTMYYDVILRIRLTFSTCGRDTQIVLHATHF